MTQRLQLHTTVGGNKRELVATGEVDMESSPRLLAAIHDGLKHAAGVVVDLAGLTYIDSSGIAVLVQGLKAANKQARSFVLRRPSPQVLAVLRLAQLLELFQIDQGGDKAG